MFDTIKKTNPVLLKRLSGRLFFVVNKVDVHKFAAGWSVEECRRNIVQCVTKAVDSPGFVLKSEQARYLNIWLLTDALLKYDALWL